LNCTAGAISLVDLFSALAGSLDVTIGGGGNPLPVRALSVCGPFAGLKGIIVGPTAGGGGNWPPVCGPFAGLNSVFHPPGGGDN
jgi:hypothetical protein